MSLTRKEGRVLAFQGLCAWDAGSLLDDVLLYSWIEDEKLSSIKEDDLLFPTLLIRGTLEHIEEIDAKIKKKLEHWDFSRLNILDKANLRLGVYSLLYQKDVPSSIIISEAIHIAEEYGTDQSYKFVNGILDSIKNSL